MDDFKIHDLRCFDAVAREGGFQAAARALNRTHPSVFAAVARLEDRLGLKLLDRSGYRAALTDAGKLFHARARLALENLEGLSSYAGQLASGEETRLRVVCGDLCPRAPILGALSGFFADHPRTRLHLDYEAVGGPYERLADGEADLVFHRLDLADPRLDHVALGEVTLLPVAAPGFLPFAITDALTPEQMRPLTQCLLRDTARRTAPESHFVIEGAHQCSAPDHQMKRELILHGMAWGHLPGFLIEDDLRDGRLLSLRGRHMPGRTEVLAAMRRRDRPHGPVAEALWDSLREGTHAWRV